MNGMLIRRDDIVRFDPLEDALPPVWIGPHVGRRICEALRTLRTLPMPSVAGYGVTWPTYAYEWEDLLAQHEQGELEKTQQLQNRTRLLPSYGDITRMEAAIYWPALYLAAIDHLMRAVNLVAFAHSLERDAGWVAAKRGGCADTWRQRHDQGCELIAKALCNARVSVF
jgi:hypothetical protein